MNIKKINKMSTNFGFHCEDDIEFNSAIEQNDIEIFSVENHNVLMLGESRTGKTTFCEIIKNVNHVTTTQVWSGTITPVSQTILYKMNNKFINLNITKLSLILLTINGSSGINAAQIKNITTCLKFLGRQVSQKTCFLVTHFENKSPEEEQKWIAEFSANPHMRFLLTAAGGGFLFTGALDKTQFNIVTLRDGFINQQRRRNALLFSKVLEGSPVPLMSTLMTEARSHFAIQESIVGACMNLMQLIPEVKEIYKHALNTRLQISEMIASGKITDEDLLTRAKDTVDQLAILGNENNDIDKLKLEDNVVTMKNEYERIGKEIRTRYDNVLDLNTKYSELDHIGTLMYNELDWKI